MTDIQPALTAEEWAEHTNPAREWGASSRHSTPFGTWFESNHGADPYPHQHALAALALHGQPFGFTREDVAFLRYNAKHAREQHGDLIAEAFDFDGLAARIAALLPPEPNA